MRRTFLTLAFFAFAAAPVSAADPLKYLPDGTGAYVHINVKQLLTAPVVRKAVPLAFDKYGDKLVELIGVVKQLDPNAKDLPEEDIKKAIGELKKPASIAQGFDAAREFLTDIIVAGDLEDDPEKSLVIVQCNPAVTAFVEIGMNFVEQSKQAKLTKHEKAGKPTIYEIEIEQIGKSAFIAVPEAGVVTIGGTKANVTEALAKVKSSKPAKLDKQLQELIAKRNPNDFFFMAGIKGADEDREVSFASLALDKDVSGRFNVTYENDAKAKAGAQQIEQGVTHATEMLKNWLGDSDKALTEAIEKVKAKSDGKKVSVSLTLPGSAVENLLKKGEKDKEKD